MDIFIDFRSVNIDVNFFDFGENPLIFPVTRSLKRTPTQINTSH